MVNILESIKLPKYILGVFDSFVEFEDCKFGVRPLPVVLVFHDPIINIPNLKYQLKLNFTILIDLEKLFFDRDIFVGFIKSLNYSVFAYRVFHKFLCLHVLMFNIESCEFFTLNMPDFGDENVNEIVIQVVVQLPYLAVNKIGV